MVYWKPLLLTDKDMGQDEIAKAVCCICDGVRQRDVYCILLPQNPTNLFEIMNANELLFPYYQKKKIYALGLAKGRENAVKLVCRFLAEAYQREETPDIRGMFSDYSEWKDRVSRV